MSYKNMNSKYIFYSLIAYAALVSCSTPQNITYFQDLQNGQTLKPQTAYDIRVRPEDKLSIIVSTPDPALSSLFNLVSVQTQLRGNATVGSNIYASNPYVAYYTVDSDGNITFPVVGKLHLTGMKRAEVAEFIEKKLIEEDLVKQPVVTVEFINTGVSVLGEVARPGRYEFNKDRLTIMEAISMAGDLKNTGQRENIMVIRDNDGKKETYILDLTDAKSLAQSPAYYLQQEDIVYIEPNDKAKRETTAAGNTIYTPSFWISVGSIGITLATFIVTLTR